MVSALPRTPIDLPNFNPNDGFPTFYSIFSFLQFLLYVSWFVGPIGPVFGSIGPLWHRLAPIRQCETRRSRRHRRRLREPQAQRAHPEWPKKEVGRDKDSIGIPTPTQPSPPKNIKLSHMGFGKVLTRQKYAEKWWATVCPPYRGIWSREVFGNSIFMIWVLLGKATSSQNGIRSFLFVLVLETTSFYFLY